jgi:hypothetical protein
MKLMRVSWAKVSMALAATGTIIAVIYPLEALAAPTAEVAKRCVHYSYIAYPFKRPGAVQMSGDRQAYFKDCVAKNGEVPAPERPKQ